MSNTGTSVNSSSVMGVDRPTAIDASGTLPFVSVVMPVRNEASFIHASVGSVLAQDYPPERMELIVADGESVDGTKEILAGLAAFDPRLRVINNPALIMAAGFNAGLAVARGRIVAMMGGHAEVPPTFLSDCVHFLLQGTADCVGGVLCTKGDSSEARAISLATSSRFGVGGTSFRVGSKATQYVDTVAFGVYRKEVFEVAGPLDQEMVRNQDDEFNYRIRQLGARIVLDPKIRTVYHCRTSTRRLCKQYYEYGLWKVRVLQKHPRQMQARQFVPAVLVGTILLGLLCSPFSLARLVLAATVLLYIIANLAAALTVAFPHDLRLFPRIALAFGALHFSYGLGCLTGLVRFARRWSFHHGQLDNA